MGKYLRKFETEAAYTAAESTLALPNVSLITATDRVAYKAGSPTPPAHDYSLDYFTLVAIDNCHFSFYMDGTMSASTDGGKTWIALYDEEEEYATNEIDVNAGVRVLFKSDGGIMGGGEPCLFQNTGNCSVEGNIMSLVHGDDFVGVTSLEGCYFDSFFLNNQYLISAENLVLPATTLTGGCYAYMFQGCTNLETAPALLATTLADNCYNGMFYGCTSLTTAPELLATTLADDCYAYMFNGCTSLSGITCLATDISAEHCTAEWVDGVAASGTFTKAASMTDWETGISGIPSGWNVVNA